MGMEHDMAVNQLSETEAKAIVLSLRTLLTFEKQSALTLERLHEIAYAKDKATKMFQMAMESD